MAPRSDPGDFLAGPDELQALANTPAPTRPAPPANKVRREITGLGSDSAGTCYPRDVWEPVPGPRIIRPSAVCHVVDEAAAYPKRRADPG